MEFVNAITKATTGEMEALSDKAKKLGGLTIFTPGDIASGMQFMGMAAHFVKI
jgi:hypothetical protein